MSAVLTPPQANSPHARDIASLMHGMTNLVRHEQDGPMILDEGHGVYVRDLEGNEYIEGMAGLWCTALGFDNERLIQAAIAQMRKLPTYHTFFQRSNMPAIDLAEKLLAMAPAPMARVWFANSGSEANDHMVKFVWYCNNALGRPEKKKIIAREHGYHGIAVSSGSLTGLPAMHKGFDLPIPNVIHTASHHYYRCAYPGESEEAFATRRAEELEQLILAEGPDTVAAFVAEPVLGAGGAVIPPKTYFEKIQQVLAKYDVLMVADEVITGFFRTGNRFACETYGIRPDILVIAKQLSSAYLPISAVILNEKVYGADPGAVGQERHPRHRLHLFGPSGARRGRAGDDEDLRRDGCWRPRAQGLEARPGAAGRSGRSPARRGRLRRGPHRLGRDREGQGDEGELRPLARRMDDRRLHPARRDPARLHRGRDPHRVLPAAHHHGTRARQALRPLAARARRHSRPCAERGVDVAAATGNPARPRGTTAGRATVLPEPYEMGWPLYGKTPAGNAPPVRRPLRLESRHAGEEARGRSRG